MGRSTRFFGARVLRSGRRVSTGPTTDNLVDLKSKVNEVVSCNKQGNAVGCRVWNVNKDVDGFDGKSRMDVDEGEPELERPDLFNIEEKKVEEIVDKMYGIVYRRKGKRKRGKENEGRQYFRRKKRREVCSNKYGRRSSVVPNVSKGQRESLLKISIVVGSCGIRRASISSYSIISSLLHSILRYLRRADIRLWSLRAFVCMEPIVHVFAAHGIRFLQNFNSVGEVGSCTIAGVRSSVPVLSVDFAALPFVFLHLHSSLSLWSARLFYFSGTDLNRSESEDELNFINEFSSCMHLKRNETGCEFMVGTNSGTDLHRSETEEKLNPVNELSSIMPLKRNQTGCVFMVDTNSGTDLHRSETKEKLNSVNEFSSIMPLKRNQTGCEFMVDTNARSFYFSGAYLNRSESKEELNSINEFSSFMPLKRNQTGCEFVVDIGTIVMALPAPGANKVGDQSVHIKSGCKIQKRRNSLRKPNRASCHSIFRSRHDGIQLSSQVSTHQLRSSNRRKVLSDVNKQKSTSVEITQKTGAGRCSANILVIEPDKCYRIKGAITTLELSESSHWCLTIRKDGVKRYSITAQNVMRPCGSNRITHDIIWSRDSDLKLEFPNRHNWLIFKELYKECFERNLKMPVPSFIPVPRVSEVDSYGEISYLPFERPSCYISVKDDELTRALKKQTANYDMDSDDEDWLQKFNSAYNEQCEIDEDLSAERFELMIDAFEKAYHCNPDVSTHAEAAYRIFPDLEKKVVEAVYNNWIMKRKLRRAALVRVFQCYQLRKSRFISTFSSRKKRSSKRQGIQASRGKQRSFFHAFYAEQDAIEQQNILKLEEAKATLERLENLASQKRQRAQELFEISELATYKALMAVRIAEAAQLTESTDVAVSYIIGQTF